MALVVTVGAGVWAYFDYSKKKVTETKTAQENLTKIRDELSTLNVSVKSCVSRREFDSKLNELESKIDDLGNFNKLLQVELMGFIDAQKSFGKNLDLLTTQLQKTDNNVIASEKNLNNKITVLGNSINDSLTTLEKKY